MTLRKKITAATISALMIAPMGLIVGETNLAPTAVHAATQNNLVQWNAQNDSDSNAASKEPRTNMPDQVHFTSGNPTQGFKFTLPGSNKVYSATASSPLAHQLKALGTSHAGDNGGAGPTQPTLKTTRPSTQPTKQSAQHHGKLTQTGESSNGAEAARIGGSLATILGLTAIGKKVFEKKHSI